MTSDAVNKIKFTMSSYFSLFLYLSTNIGVIEGMPFSVFQSI